MARPGLRDLDAKERYITAQSRLEELEADLASYARIYSDIQGEIAEIKKVVDRYKPIPTV